MANRRMINKDDFESLEFQSLSVMQKYLFWATNLYADDDGILPFRYAKPKLFPLDEEITNEQLLKEYKQMEELNFIALYDNDEFIQICDWWERQFVDLKQYKMTKYPKPPGYCPRPENMTTWKTSREFLEQKRREQYSGVKNTLEGNKEEEDFPLDN